MSGGFDRLAGTSMDQRGSQEVHIGTILMGCLELERVWTKGVVLGCAMPGLPCWDGWSGHEGSGVHCAGATLVGQRELKWTEVKSLRHTTSRPPGWMTGAGVAQGLWGFC